MQNADEIETLLFNDEPIRENVYIYYKLRNEDANCIQLKSTSEDDLDKLSWIYGERKKQRWRLAEHVDASGENQPTRQVYVNLHRETGLKYYTVQEDISYHDDLLARYNNNDPARTVVESNGELEFLSVAEAERRLEKLGKVEYLKNNQLLNKEVNKDEEMEVDLEIANTEFVVQETQNLPEVSFYSQMDVNGIFNAQPDFESGEFYSKDISCRKSVKQVFGAGRITLKRLMILVLEEFYAIYLWLIAMAIVDQNSQHSSFEAQVFCWTSAQHCLEVMQMVCDIFKIKMLLKDSELLVISPQSQTVEYTFVLTQRGLPMIYKGDRFPGTVSEVAANVMKDFGAHNRFAQVSEMEEMLLERIHAAVLRLRDENTEDSDLEQASREKTSERMTDAFGNGKKRGRKSSYFNFADDLQPIRSTPRKSNGVNLKETKIFSLIKVLKAPGEAQTLARDLFDVSRDDVPHSTRLEANKTRDEHVRERRRSRSRESDNNGFASRRTSRSRSGSRVHFNPGPSQNRMASAAGTNTLAAQCVLNVTNPDETQWPLATSVHRQNPDFTQGENEMMGVTEKMPENEKLTKRSDYIKYYALYSEEHGTAALIDQIKDKIEESSILFDQSPKDIENWKASAIKDFAKEYKEIQIFNKALRDTSQKLLSRMNECIESGTISELCWKVGKSATQAADIETKRLLGLIKTNNTEMSKRNISKCDKDIKITHLKDMVGTFSGEDLAKSVDARTFQQFKKELEDAFEHYQVDTNNWGFYTKSTLTGEAKETLEREMPGETNPDYNTLMEHLQRYHGRPKDVLTAIKKRQLLLGDITSNTSPRQKQEICKHHRTCFDKIKGVLSTTQENVGMMREHMVRVLLKFPDHHRYEIKKLLDDDSKPNLDQAIDAFQALCRNITDMAKDESCNEGFDTINQTFSAVTPVQAASFKPRPKQDKPSVPNQPKSFSLKEVEPADCKVCKQLHAFRVDPLSSSKTHVMTSYNTPVTDACPNLIKLSTENKEKKAKLIKLCRRCGRDYLDATHSEQKCPFNVKAIQCVDDKCQLLAAYCGQHREKNIPIHEVKQKRLKKLGLHYNFSCQVVRKGSHEEGHALCLPTNIRYTYENLKQMMKCQDPRTTISYKEGMPIFPMGLMWTPAGGTVSYGYDGGASMSSVLLGSEGESFHTAPVSGDEYDWQTISCAAGYINVRLAYILINLIDGSMARIKVQLVDYTMECQTRNLKQLTRGLESEAKAAGVMKEGERIQFPVYQSKAVLLLGRSHAHLAPKVVYTTENGLSLYEGCIAGPRISKGPNGQERTLCVGGSLALKQESKETLNKAGQDEGMEQCVKLLREAALANEKVMSADQTLLSEETNWNKESSEHSSNDCWENLSQSPYSEFGCQDNLGDADQLMVNEEAKKWGPKYRRRNGSPTLYYSSN